MIDIHCHMLPGIDDGARSMDESLAMARMAVADGLRGMICTPHWHPMIWPNERAGIRESLAALRARLQAEGLPPGPELGEWLKRLETYWEEQDFEPGAAYLLQYFRDARDSG